MSDNSDASTASAHTEQGPFAPYVSKATGPATGPDWMGSYPAQSLRRIRASATVEEAGVQATTEAVVLLHSIRRMLMWTLVIVPMIAAGLAITMIVVSGT
ncbi:hypothetical protein BBK82_16725 [Lentzea guizhouensis]|uniref:Uncharacterized protein n=1 Tax=Lentzea guizhouensis TaxID=1586287 RepID=A0A1B2HIB5_9PSEU|nr:hypothetical protein [Lentzea guizhouensis]ANZ37446.1 hypothetical protein BBK82_16725 [Lentzea guizhouensis]